MPGSCGKLQGSAGEFVNVQVVSEQLQQTAYVLAAEIAAADLNVSAEEVRLLQLPRNHLDIDKLTCAALELAARARHQSA